MGDRIDSIIYNGDDYSILERKIIADIKGYRIFNEADLHIAVAHYLRSEIFNREDMSIRSKPYLGGVGKYPDLVIFKGLHPQVAIEFKWWFPRKWSKQSAQKDRQKLRNIKSTYDRISKGYFFFVYYDPEEEEFPSFTLGYPWEKYYYFEIPINISCIFRSVRMFNDWWQEWDKRRMWFDL